jgi:hypothetical protein
MNVKLYCGIIALLLCNINTRAQHCVITFSADYAAMPLQCDNLTTYAGNRQDSFRFETLKCYISQLELYQGGKSIWAEKNSYHLLDFSEPTSQTWMLQIPKGIIYDQIKFHLGIDSSTNVSGALGGDLDPTKGMYWTWQSGYINTKIEGSRYSGVERKEFQWHIGGYQSPYNALQKITLKVQASDRLNIALDLSQLMEQIDWEKTSNIMSPKEEALILAEMFSKIFSVGSHP